MCLIYILFQLMVNTNFSLGIEIYPFLVMFIEYCEFKTTFFRIKQTFTL